MGISGVSLIGNEPNSTCVPVSDIIKFFIRIACILGCSSSCCVHHGNWKQYFARGRLCWRKIIRCNKKLACNTFYLEKVKIHVVLYKRIYYVIETQKKIRKNLIFNFFPTKKPLRSTFNDICWASAFLVFLIPKR